MIRGKDTIHVFQDGKKVETWSVLDRAAKNTFRVRTDKGNVFEIDRRFSSLGFKDGKRFQCHRKGRDSWWVPRFDSFADASHHMFDVVPDRRSADGVDRYRVLNVPVMKTYTSRNSRCDESALDRMVANFYMPINATAHLAGGGEHGSEVADKFGFRPKVHIHHTVDDPSTTDHPEVIGHVQDMYRAGSFIMADFGGIDGPTLSVLRSGKYPDRSPEVDPKRNRILSIALLGAECPHFGFPQMRHFGFTDQIERHGSDKTETVHHRFKGVDFMDLYTPFSVLDRFRRLPTTDARRVRFEALFHDHLAQQSQAAPAGGGAGEGMQVANLEATIRNVILQMQSERFNTTPTSAAAAAGSPQYGMGAVPGGPAMGGTGAVVPTPQHFQKAVDDILDLENNYTYHASAGVDPTDLEPGTKVEGPAESPTKPMPGPQSGDSGVTQRGQPSSAEPKDGGVDEYDDQAKESGLTKNDLEVAIRTVRHAIDSSTVDDQTGAALNVLVQGQEKITKHFRQLIKSNTALSERVIRQEGEIEVRKQTERHQRIREQLVKMRGAGYVGVGDETAIERHADLIGSLDEGREKLYFDNLRAAGQIRPGDRIQYADSSSQTSRIGEMVERHKAELATDPDKREMARLIGVDPETLALAEMWGEMDTPESMDL